MIKILDKDYYENAIDQNNFTNITQKDLFNKYQVIFVGVSFTDGNLKEILRKRIINGENIMIDGGRNAMKRGN